MRARPSTAVRPRRPGPECETCGAEVWWAWSLVGKCWLPLEPRRHPLEGTFGTFEVWRDVHGGLLATSLAPGERGDQPGAWRGAHHNVACGTWPRDVTAALVAESARALPLLTDDELLALGAALRDVEAGISRTIRDRAVSAP